MEPMIPSSMMRTAIELLLESDTLHLMIVVFGVSVAVIFSLLYLWDHAKEGKA